MGSWARDVRRIVEELTLRQDLEPLTLLQWTNVVSGLRVCRRHRAWCAACYQEAKKRGEPVYDMLLWTLQVVDVCPRHGPLRDRCPHCGERQRVISSLSRPGYCALCLHWLGEPARGADNGDRGGTEGAVADIEWSWWVARTIGDILAAATPHRPWPDEGRVALVLAQHAEAAGSSGVIDLARQMDVVPRTIYQWKEGNQVPRLELLLRLCYHLDIAPLAMMTGDGGAHSHPLSTPEPRGEVSTGGKGRRRRVVDVEGIRKRMRAIVDADEQPPPSHANVARRLGVTPQQLHNLCPAQSRVIIERYAADRRRRKGERADHIRRLVFGAVAAARSEGASLSWDAVFARIPKNVSTLDPISRDAYRAALGRNEVNAGST